MKVDALPPPRPVSAYGSEGASYRKLAPLPQGAVGVLALGPGGRLGRHDAPSRQVALVLAGAGWASGADGARRPVAAGDVVAFEPGEPHETVAGPEGMTLLVVEGAGEVTSRAGPRSG